MKTFIIVYIIGWLVTFLWWTFTDDFNKKFDFNTLWISALAWWVQWVVILLIGFDKMMDMIADGFKKLFKKDA